MQTAALLVAVAVLSSGCLGLFRKPEPPRVTVAEVRLLELTLLEQKYEVALRVQNPNDFALAIEGFDYQLFVNDGLVASGVGNRPVTIPAYGTEVVGVEGVGSVAEALKRLFDLRRGPPDKLHYRLMGHVQLKSSPVRFSFDQTGEFPWNEGRNQRGI